MSSKHREVGGYTSSVLAADGTEVLHVELKCDEVAGQAAVNTAMAQATFNEGKAFLQTYKAQALQAYANDPNGFQPYYCVGAYNVTRSTNGYASFWERFLLRRRHRAGAVLPLIPMP